MEELIKEFWEEFHEYYKDQNPDSVNGYDYERFFKNFWEEKGFDAWKYEIEKDKGCYEKHCDIYDPDTDDVDGAYDRAVGK